MKRKIIILSDFDGTISQINVLEHLYDRFAAPSHKAIVERWYRGEISTRQEIEACFATIKASRIEMESSLKDIPIDPGFASFPKFCQESGYAFAVVSDGLRWYIEYLFSQFGLEEITVYANEISFDGRGYQFKFPWYDQITPLRGISKLAITRQYQEKGYQVIFIGDGMSDIEAVGEADFVFARDYLLEFVHQQGIDAVEFGNFNHIIDELRNRF